MDAKEQNIDLLEFPANANVIRLQGNPMITKKRDIPASERPRMYLKVQEALAGVKSDFSQAIIEGR